MAFGTKQHGTNRFGVPGRFGAGRFGEPLKLKIGDFYLGGIVTYLDASGQHGFVAALTDQSAGTAFSNITGLYAGASAESVGTGASNTDKIINQVGHTASAASLCRNLGSDWHLPSKNELGLMYAQKTIIGLASANYWSSSEYGAGIPTIARAILSNGSYDTKNKTDSTIRVRAIRYF